MAFRRQIDDDESSTSSIAVLTRRDELQLRQMNVMNDVGASTSDESYRKETNFYDSERSGHGLFPDDESTASDTFGGARNFGYGGDAMRRSNGMPGSGIIRTPSDTWPNDSDQTRPKQPYVQPAFHGHSQEELQLLDACWWRGAILLLVLAVFVAVIVVLMVVVNRQDPEPQGLVLEDPERPKECQDIVVALNYTMAFNCTFNLLDTDRIIMRQATGVIVESPSVGSGRFRSTFTTTDNSTTKAFFIRGLSNMRCSFVGTYTLNFVNNSNKTLVTIDVIANVTQPEVRFNVERIEDTLTFTCSFDDSCGNIELGFWGKTDNGNVSLNTARFCSGSHDDESGYSYTCTAEYTVESLVGGDIASIWCKHNEKDGPEMLLTDILSEAEL